jgi:hypothetical protein
MIMIRLRFIICALARSQLKVEGILWVLNFHTEKLDESHVWTIHRPAFELCVGFDATTKDDRVGLVKALESRIDNEHTSLGNVDR